MAPTRVLICDDSLGFPGLVATWLDRAEEFQHVGTAGGGEELKRLATEVEFDALVLDLVLPDVVDPGVLISELRDARPGIRVVLVSSLQQPMLRDAANAARADAFCHKASTPEDLLAALRG